MRHRDDEALVHAAQARGTQEGEAAAEELYRRYYKFAAVRAMRHVSRDEAEEVAQEAFVEALNKYLSVPEKRGFRSHVAMVAASRAIDRDRATHGRADTKEGRRTVVKVDVDVAQVLPSGDESVLDRLADNEIAVQLRAVLATYPNDRHAKIFQMYVLDGVLMHVIAERFNVTESRISQILTSETPKIERFLLRTVERSASSKRQAPRSLPAPALEEREPIPVETFRELMARVRVKLAKDIAEYEERVQRAEARVAAARKRLGDLTK